MSHSIWQVIANTPWWVFFLFVYLIRVSYVATKPRIIPLKSMLILPSIFVTLSIFGLANIIKLDSYNILLWLAALLVGSSLGWLQFYALKIKAIKEGNKIYIPGTWSVFFIVLTIFSIKYYFNVELALDPASIAASKYGPIFILMYGLFTGLFFGRLAYSIRCVKSGPYLSEPLTLKSTA